MPQSQMLSLSQLILLGTTVQKDTEKSISKMLQAGSALSLRNTAKAVQLDYSEELQGALRDHGRLQLQAVLHHHCIAAARVLISHSYEGIDATTFNLKSYVVRCPLTTKFFASDHKLVILGN